MDGDPTDAVHGRLDLASVDADPDLKVEPLHRVSDLASALHRAGCAVERDEEPVAGRIDLATAESLYLSSDDPVVIAQRLAPACVAEARCGRCGVDDVRHQHRHDLAR